MLANVLKQLLFLVYLAILSTTTNGALAASTTALFGWAPALGPVEGYVVYASLNDGAYPSEPSYTLSTPYVAISGQDGERVRIKVAAFKRNGEIGPLSSASPRVTFPVAEGSLSRCITGECIGGGGSVKKDCNVEFFGNSLSLNYPPDYQDGRPRKKTELRCTDGDPQCDLDAKVNGSCRFNVDLCFMALYDPNFPSCTPGPIEKIKVRSRQAENFSELLQNRVESMLPISAPVCTSGHHVTLPLKISNNGELKRATAQIRVSIKGDRGPDSDRLRLRCVPNE